MRKIIVLVLGFIVCLGVVASAQTVYTTILGRTNERLYPMPQSELISILQALDGGVLILPLTPVQIATVAGNIPRSTTYNFSASLGAFSPASLTVNGYAPTSINVILNGPGGGGEGNSSSPGIDYALYGRVGVPTAWGVGVFKNVAMSCTPSCDGTHPVVVTSANHDLFCNDLLQFANSGGALPSGVTSATLYYVMCDGSITTNTFEFSAVQFQAPLTCGVYAPFCQTAIEPTSAGSGQQTALMYDYDAQTGGGGGGPGDEAVPGSSSRCANATQNGYGVQGATGYTPYVNNSGTAYGGAGIGGAGHWGGGGTGGAGGSNETGGGGAGAVPTATSSGGGGGGGGGWCDLVFKPSDFGGTWPIFYYFAGAGGAGGAAGVGGSAGGAGSNGAIIVRVNYGLN